MGCEDFAGAERSTDASAETLSRSLRDLSAAIVRTFTPANRPPTI